MVCYLRSRFILFNALEPREKQASERIDGGYALTGSDGESSSASEVLLKPRKKGEKATVSKIQ